MTDPLLDAFFGYVRLRIPTATEAEAPVLFEGAEHLRHHAGRWWRPLEYPDAPDQHPLCVLSRGGSIDAHTQWQAILDHADIAVRVRVPGPITLLPSGPAMTLPPSRDDPNRFEARLLELKGPTVGASLMIDGVLHCACDGPAIVLEHVPDRGCRAWIATASEATLTGRTALFAHDRWNDALAMARALGTPDLEYPRHVRIDPGAPARDDAALAPAEIAHALLAGCNVEGLALIAPEALVLVSVMRGMTEADRLSGLALAGTVDSLLAATAAPDPIEGIGTPAVRAQAEAARLAVRDAALFARARLSFESHGWDEDVEALLGLTD